MLTRALDTRIAGLELVVLDYIRRNHLLREPARLVAAVSGGCDSVCLLHILYRLKESLGLDLRVAHLNHGLRGGESDADAEYVAGLARRLGLPATVERRDVTDYQRRTHTGLEEAARQVRYTFLAEVAAAVGADGVAVGHTLDDNVETILMHLVRGAGVRGLTGLQASSNLPIAGLALNIVRPLLQVSRQETVDYCRRHGLEARYDSSNDTPVPLRNRVRLQLIPLLEQYNPRIKEALLRTAGLAGDYLDFINAEVDRVWESAVSLKPGLVLLNRLRLQRLPRALQQNLLLRAIQTLSGTIQDIEAGHIQGMLDLVDKPAGKRLELPGGLILQTEYKHCVLAADRDALSPFPPLKQEYGLSLPGETRLPGWSVRAEIVDSFPGRPDNPYTAYFDLDILGEDVKIRTRRPGDAFQPLGMGDPVKIKDFMINACIPRAWRQHLPLLVAGERVAWVAGWRIDERVKVTPETRRVVVLHMERQDD